MTRRGRLVRIGFVSVAVAIACGALATGIGPVVPVGDQIPIGSVSIPPIVPLLVMIAGLSLLTSIISFIMAILTADK